MKNTLKNYIFKNELAAFYVNIFEESENVTGQLSVTENGQANALLIKLSPEFQKKVKNSEKNHENFPKLPQIWGKILKTGQPFYLYRPVLKPAFSAAFDRKTEMADLGDFEAFWEISEVDAVLFFDYAQKGKFYFKHSAPPKPRPDFAIKSFLWDLEDFRGWLGAFVRCRYQPDPALQHELKKTAGERISRLENGELVFIPYEFKNEIQTYKTRLGEVKISRKCSLGEMNPFQTEGRIRTSGSLQIQAEHLTELDTATLLYAGVSGFFRSFISRDQQISYPEIKLENDLCARLIVPQMALKREVAAQNFFYQNLQPFSLMKGRFGDYLVRYLEQSRQIPSGYSIYVRDIYKLEQSEEAFFFLAASLEQLLHYLLSTCFSQNSDLILKIDRILALLEVDIAHFGNNRAEKEAQNSLKDAKSNFEFVQKLLKGEGENFEKILKRLYFKNRLFLVIDLLECDLPWQEVRCFVEEFSALRNYLAHQATIFEMGKTSSGSARLTPILSALRMMMCAILMKSIGFEKEMIKTALQSNEFTAERNNIPKSSSFAGLFNC